MLQQVYVAVKDVCFSKLVLVIFVHYGQTKTSLLKRK